MQRMPSRGNADRPEPVKTRSFSRYEGSPVTTPSARSAANAVLPGEDPLRQAGAAERDDVSGGDLFESRVEYTQSPTVEEEESIGVDSDLRGDVPIEIQSLMDRFLESLSSSSQSSSLSIDQLAELFQDFYGHVESNIGTHIAALSTKISREKSPSPSVSSMGSAGSRTVRRGARSHDKHADGGPTHQMLTASEIADKRKARRQLEVKRVALEEAVERGVCEKFYTKIWRPRSTDDDERDEKVRSRAAALNVVGVGLHELLVTGLGDAADLAQKGPGPSIELASAQLASAKANLEEMNNSHSPAGKLKALKATHKAIVEALSQMFPSTSSADEILPTLIYTIICSSPATLQLVSNMAFVQRFRNSSKIDGETAYCLTNLEAAITFLETVDISSLRPGDQAKATKGPPTPRTEKADPLYQGLATALPDSPKKASAAEGHKRNRSLSTMLRQGPRPLEAAVESADLAYDKIQSALDSSFQYFFGRYKEKQAAVPPAGPQLKIPKTLEDARKLVGDAENADDAGSLDGSSLAPSETLPEENSARGKTLELIAGRKSTPKEPLSDGVNSNSSKRVGGLDTKAQGTTATTANDAGTVSAAATSAAALSFTAAESMRNLSNSLNTLRLGGWGSMRGFGRPTSGSSTDKLVLPPPDGQATNENTVGQLNQADTVPRIDLSGIAPPIQKYVDLKEPKELTFFDVELLLRDYQRLAGALNALGGNAKSSAP